MTKSIRKAQKSLRKKSANKIGHDQAESWRPKELKRKAEEKVPDLDLPCTCGHTIEEHPGRSECSDPECGCVAYEANHD